MRKGVVVASFRLGRSKANSEGGATASSSICEVTCVKRKLPVSISLLKLRMSTELARVVRSKSMKRGRMFSIFKE